MIGFVLGVSAVLVLLALVAPATARHIDALYRAERETCVFRYVVFDTLTQTVLVLTTDELNALSARRRGVPTPDDAAAVVNALVGQATAFDPSSSLPEVT